MRHSVLLVLCLLTAAATCACGKDAEKPDDKAAIQGHWVRQYAQCADKIVRGYEGMQYVLYGEGGCNIFPNGKTHDFKVILDQTTSPKRMTMKFGEQVTRAVYQLDGDSMKVIIRCDDKNEEWPTEFVAGPQDILFVDKRVTAD